MEITEQLIERLEPEPECDYCERGKYHEKTRELGPFNHEVDVVICTSCWTTEVGAHFLPPKRSDSGTGRSPNVVMEADESRAQYRGSGKKIMSGALTAYENIEEDYGTDDGTASYEQFVTA